MGSTVNHASGEQRQHQRDTGDQAGFDAVHNHELFEFDCESSFWIPGQKPCTDEVEDDRPEDREREKAEDESAALGTEDGS